MTQHILSTSYRIRSCGPRTYSYRCRSGGGFVRTGRILASFMIVRLGLNQSSHEMYELAAAAASYYSSRRSTQREHNYIFRVDQKVQHTLGLLSI